jgi:hypothetical protein
MYTVRIQNSIYKTHAQFLIYTLCIQIAFEIYHFLHKTIFEVVLKNSPGHPKISFSE